MRTTILNDGILLIDKPVGKTSNQVIQIIKKKLGINKIGHAGTLDPLATGLLVVLLNNGTKISDYLLTADKGYDVTMKLFIKTDSGDITGKIIEEITPFKMKRKIIKKAFESFNGFIYEQYPPKYSAIKVSGKKLYEYARAEQEVQITPRTVTIQSIKFKSYNHVTQTIQFSVICSKGTYVRSLVEDIAYKMGILATVQQLTRVQSGNFKLADAVKVEDVSHNDIISMYDALFINKQPLLMYHYDEEIRQGKPIVIINHSDPNIFIIDKHKNVLAIYKHIGKHVYACQRGLWSNEQGPTLISKGEKY
ncbi:tRNA pseudouridine(55) synthase TruB [Spiroplasma chrysopicola]|uniref:tRNA pseudouridine synthase B n=1 Tax=Spiroplasma chrysopicola DF-1 TaxID=1276227 RepID=R4U3U2_9MOLU|nr:tRNA pseudouridine(55) synthase TruB [Spiroplasma chrysopicola]AGM25168.1 tRNA pseudouridine synthase B [Spiroplasma chrysopicola DF-1]